ncbi:hypothetical protein ASD35_03200 [Pelomonas sp. Root1444]|nr:hypothetical protein ASD35_03200 [Pelomonas sp. Root1444]
MQVSSSVPGALKAAELLSTAGAAVLGAGIALLWPRLADDAPAILVVGALTHATGMVLKQRLQRGQIQPRWSRWLFAGCWIALALLGIALVWRVAQG